MILLISISITYSTTFNFVEPTTHSRVKAGDTDVLLYQFTLTVPSVSTISGVAPSAGDLLTDTNPWDDIYFYDDGADGGDWDSGNDWIGFNITETGAYEPDNFTTISGVEPANGTALVQLNPWDNVMFYDDGADGGDWDSGNDWIGTTTHTHYLDVLNEFNITNSGTAVDTTDLVLIKLYQNNECSGTSQALSWNTNRWTASGIAWNLIAGSNSLTVCGDITGTPTDDSTIQFEIPQDEITLASGTLPSSAEETATGIITIDTTAPSLVNVTPNLLMITEADVGADNFEVEIVFDEDMDTTATKGISKTISTLIIAFVLIGLLVFLLVSKKPGKVKKN